MNLEELKNWYLGLEQSGASLDPKKIVAEYPQYAQQLQQFFAERHNKTVDQEASGDVSLLTVDSNAAHAALLDKDNLPTRSFASGGSNTTVPVRVIGPYKLLQ